MKNFLEQYGDIIVVVLVIAALVVIVGVLKTPITNGITSVVGQFQTEAGNAIDGLGDIIHQTPAAGMISPGRWFR